jgi:hypothetical protein
MRWPCLHRLSWAAAAYLKSFIFVVLLCLGIDCTCGAPFKTSEERIPPEVREAIAKQIKAYFKTNEVSGVPLVDSKD